MGIAAIVDILVTANVAQVQVEIIDSHAHDYTDIWCAAYAHEPTQLDDPQNTFFHAHVAGALTDSMYNMPPLFNDADGVLFTPETKYVIKCHADEIWNGEIFHYYLQTEITTHGPDGCHPGVHYITPTEENIHLNVLGPIQNDNIDLGHTNYYKFPSGIKGLNVYDVPRPLAAGSNLELTCCRGEECEFWVILFVCSECTGPRPQGLRSELLQGGWDAGSCSPKFDKERNTIGFHKHVNANAATWTETLHSNFDEIAVVFGIEGSARSPWCSRVPGPHILGAGSCYRNGDCPFPFDGSFNSQF